MKIQSVAILGAGAVGCYVLWGLADKAAANSLQLGVVAEGSRAERLQQNGCTINGQVYHPQVWTPQQAHGVDLLIVALKYGALPGALDSIRTIVSERTVVMSLMNGVDSEELIAAQVGAAHVLPALIKVASRRTEDGDVIWKCRCGCGKEFEASSRKLLRGSVKDCGCKLNLTQKWIGRRFGNLTVVAFEGKKDHRYMWRCRCDCGNEVVVREICLKNGHTTSCGCKVDPSRYCHFVDGTFVEAIQARTMLKNNTSGVRGVYLNQRTQRWVARIGFRGKTYYLGSFENLEDAKKARKSGEEMTFDTFLRRYREEESG